MSPKIHLLSRAVIIHDDHLLLAYDPRKEPKHYYELDVAFYYLPGGHIEFNESAEAAVLREIYEETGLDAYIERFLGILEHSWSFPGVRCVVILTRLISFLRSILKKRMVLLQFFRKRITLPFSGFLLKRFMI